MVIYDDGTNLDIIVRLFPTLPGGAGIINDPTNRSGIHQIDPMAISVTVLKSKLC
jgi:hypothetical protein